LLASKLLGVREEDVVYEILDNMEHPSSFNSGGRRMVTFTCGSI
jgi:hypothetical protein